MEKPRTKPVWSVKGRDGWHAAAPNNRPTEMASSVMTRCGNFIVLPWASEKRRAAEIDCPACKAHVIKAQP